LASKDKQRKPHSLSLDTDCNSSSLSNAMQHYRVNKSTCNHTLVANQSAEAK